MWQERADYGHFFYRIPNGESAADAYDRISGFNESLWRQFGEDDFASVCVLGTPGHVLRGNEAFLTSHILVTHGLMSRVFLMKWYHFSVEYFEDLRNVNHCEFLIMRRNEAGKYILQNKLRTWSELKRERAAIAAKEKEKGEDSKEKENGTSKDNSTLTRATSSTNVVPRRWGGCPNGCNHDKSFKMRQTLADLVKSDSIISDKAIKRGVNETGSGSSSNGTGTNTGAETPVHSHTQGVSNPSFNGNANSHTIHTGSQVSSIVSRRPAAKRFQSQTDEPATPELIIPGPQIDVTKAREEVVSSPDGTPSFISVDDRLRNHLKSPMDHHLHLQLHVGRDGGGTYSGHSSVVASDADSSEDDEHRRRLSRLNSLKDFNGSNLAPTSVAGGKTGLAPIPIRVGGSRNQSRMGRGARANRLGDHPHSSDGEHAHSSDGEHDADCEHDHHHDHDDHDQEHDDDGGELSRTLTDEADDALLKRIEKEEKSVQGSVY